MQHDPNKPSERPASPALAFFAGTLIVALVVAAILLFAPRCDPDSRNVRVGNIVMAGCPN